MLRIYSVLLELIRDLMPLVRELERREPDLARQCRRALASAPLNVAEGSQSRGRNRGARYATALGSLREAQACFEVAEVMGYLPALSAARVASFNRVIGTLVRITQGPARR
ncbi:MAG: four helix bundle protein [Polyangiaceae bacterium]|nr:four helix bundle protein [Polyangiaceae bacterium]